MSVYMKLLVVISLMLTISHVGVNSAEVRRGEPRMLTDSEITTILDEHNLLRAQEGASDMEYMTWNESLGIAAARWVAKCSKGNGYPPLPATHFADYGQNTWVASGAQIIVKDVIGKWNSEKKWYDYDTLQCRKGKRCNSYTQMVWATTRQIGCAYHYCKRVSSSNDEDPYLDAEYIACNYVPDGNKENQKPFKKGPPCSQCESGVGWCKRKLCNTQCLKADEDCSCRAVCHNCARLNLLTCRCLCADGWYGPDCSEPCEDKHKLCNPRPGSAGWMPDACNDTEQGSRTRRRCPLMCEMCKPDPNAEAGKCPPVFASEVSDAVKFVNPSTNSDNDNDDDKQPTGSQHQQQCATVTLLSNVILSLTITWKALL